ncbi:MAG TPA: NAD-dependent epimerase/dehydratase family protein [Reyranella sp.]|jgi:dTDP-L-rhamnose 4-epimerase
MIGRVLITGGAGFIGSRAALRLAREGWEVRVLDALLEQVHGPAPEASAPFRALRKSVEVIVGDVRDARTCGRALAGCSHVLHLAAETGTGQSVYSTARYADANVLGTATLCDALARCRASVETVVVASSRAVYGEGRALCAGHGAVDPPPRRHADLLGRRFEPRCPICGAAVEPLPTPETAQAAPVSVYGVTKLAQEQLVLGACRTFGLRGAALRYQNVYGAGQSLRNPYVGILPLFTGAIATGEPLQLFEDGRQTRDFVHVDDVVSATCRALAEPPAEPMAINVGSGSAVDLFDLLGEVERALGRPARATVTGEFREGDIRHNRACLGRATLMLAFAPRMSLPDGVAEFVDWADRERGALAGFAERYGRATQEMRQRGLIA